MNDKQKGHQSQTKGENYYCAEVFAKLLPWIDHSYPHMAVMVDEGGHNTQATPDMAFKLRGAQRPVTIELKLVKETSPGNVSANVQFLQIRSWHKDGSGPDFWLFVEDGDTRGSDALPTGDLPTRPDAGTTPRFALVRHDGPIRETLKASYANRSGTTVTRKGKSVDWDTASGSMPVSFLVSLSSEGRFWSDFWKQLAAHGHAP